MVFHYTNPWNPVRQLRGEVDRLWSGVFGPNGPLERLQGRPAVNVWEQGDTICVELEVPGLTSDQLELAVVADELTVKIQRPDVQQENVTYHRRERPVGTFSRVLRLPSEVNADKVDAKLNDGVLTITLPKAETAKPRKISVATG